MWRAPVVAAEPASEPLTLAEAQAHLKVEDDDDQGLITDCIVAARAHVEAMTGSRLVTQTLTLQTDRWDDLARLPTAPLSAVTAITYTDTDGTVQTLSTDVYEARLAGLDPVIVLKYGQTWPAIRTGSLITLTVTAGYGDAADVPGPIRQAILLVIGDLYAFRETAQIGSVAGKVPTSAPVDALLSNYRIFLV